MRMGINRLAVHALLALRLVRSESRAKIFRTLPQLKPVVENLWLLQPDREPFSNLCLLRSFLLINIAITRYHLRPLFALQGNLMRPAQSFSILLARKLFA